MTDSVNSESMNGDQAIDNNEEFNKRKSGNQTTKLHSGRSSVGVVGGQATDKLRRVKV